MSLYHLGEGHRFRSNFDRAFVKRKTVSSQIFSSKKFFLAFPRLFLFSLPFSSNKNFLLQLLLPKAYIDKKIFSKIYNRCEIFQEIDSRTQKNFESRACDKVFALRGF